MSTKKPVALKTTTIVANDPKDHQGQLKAIGGSQSDHWNQTIREVKRFGRFGPPIRMKRPSTVSAARRLRRWSASGRKMSWKA